MQQKKWPEPALPQARLAHMQPERRTAWGEIRGQTCRVCGLRDKFDFTVTDGVWESVVPIEYRGCVVCLGCFDDFAREAGFDYSNSIKSIYFAGDQACFKFTRIWGNVSG